MRSMKKNELGGLLIPFDGPCVSMYVDAPRGLDSPEGLSVFRTELKRASVLLGTQYPREKVVEVLSELRIGFLEASRSRPQAPLALFSSPSFSGYLHHSFPGLRRTVVADSFHVRPLLSWLDANRVGRALVARENELQAWRLFQGEPELEWVQPTDGLSDLREKLAAVESDGNSPLVFVGLSTPVVEMARGVLFHPAVPLLAFAVDGPLTVEQWLPRAEEFVLQWHQRREHRAVDEYMLGVGTARSCSSLPQVARLMRQGLVDLIIVNKATTLWGTHTEDFETLNVRPMQRDARDDDLIDDLVEEALRRKVPLLEVDAERMPHARWRPVAALVRGRKLMPRERPLTPAAG